MGLDHHISKQRIDKGNSKAFVTPAAAATDLKAWATARVMWRQLMAADSIARTTYIGIINFITSTAQVRALSACGRICGVTRECIQ